jgi:hypothetical protein
MSDPIDRVKDRTVGFGGQNMVFKLMNKEDA